MKNELEAVFTKLTMATPEPKDYTGEDGLLCAALEVHCGDYHHHVLAVGVYMEMHGAAHHLGYVHGRADVRRRVVRAEQDHP